VKKYAQPQGRQATPKAEYIPIEIQIRFSRLGGHGRRSRHWGTIATHPIGNFPVQGGSSQPKSLLDQTEI